MNVSACSGLSDVCRIQKRTHCASVCVTGCCAKGQQVRTRSWLNYKPRNANIVLYLLSL